MSGAIARPRAPARVRSSRQSSAGPGLPCTKTTASEPSAGPAASTGDRTPLTETSTVVMLTSDPSSLIVFGRCWPAGHGLERDIVRMPGQAFSPDVLGGEGAHLA